MSALSKTTQDQLRQYIEQIERLNEEKREIAEAISEKFLEAKSNGFDVKAMRKVLALRKLSQTERQEREAMTDLYLHALGMLSDTPLGQAAMERDGIYAPL